MTRPISTRVKISARTMGEQLLTWRKLYKLTAQQVAERAGISRGTLRKVETGDPNVSFYAVLSTAKALGMLEPLVKATDPYETDLGRARADQILPKRVR